MTEEKRPQGRQLTPEEREKAQAVFLQEYAKTGNVTAACAKARVSRNAIYEWQEHDEAFSPAFQQAREAYCDALRAEIHRRAVVGIIDPIYQQGVMVGRIRKFSDTLLIFHAKAKMPEYRDSQAGAGDGTPQKLYSGFDAERV